MSNVLYQEMMDGIIGTWKNGYFAGIHKGPLTPRIKRIMRRNHRRLLMRRVHWRPKK